MNPRIEKLIRSNIALMALCIISIGALILLFRQSGRNEEAAATGQSIPKAVAQSDISPAAQTSASQTAPSIPADASFAGMPAPSSFRSFVYSPASTTISVSGTCADAYRVILIYPVAIDYRSDPAAADYNAATPCAKGQPFAESVDLSGFHLSEGGAYYLIRASEGRTGTWHDPY